MNSGISTEDPSYRKYVPVLHSRMAYVDVGTEIPSSFCTVIPRRPTFGAISSRICCLWGVASRLDYAGMGNSAAAADGNYRLQDHQRYLDAWLDTVGVNKNVILVVHDWGSALGFSWAQRHSDQIRALVYMEAIVRLSLSWDEWPEATRGRN
jgi:haloalkane dehalogenase